MVVTFSDSIKLNPLRRLEFKVKAEETLEAPSAAICSLRQLCKVLLQVELKLRRPNSFKLAEALKVYTKLKKSNKYRQSTLSSNTSTPKTYKIKCQVDLTRL